MNIHRQAFTVVAWLIWAGVSAVKMAEEADSSAEAVALRHRFYDLISELKRSSQSPLDASNRYCQDFCQILMNHGHQRKPDEDPRYLLEMYTVAIVCYAEAILFLCPECEHVTDVLDKLSWSCLNLLLSFSEQIPGALWEKFQSSVMVAQNILQAHGNSQLHSLATLVEENGVWTNITLCSLLSGNMPDEDKVHEFLTREGPDLLHMRLKHLIKHKHVEKAARLAKTCAEFTEFGGKKNFKQIYLVCLCEIKSQQELMQEIKEVDCKDALDMICNLESEEDEKGALSLCTAFFRRQLLCGDVYCAWELTLFWSKLLIRLESKQTFLEQCRLLARLSGNVYHILLLIKVVQAEVDKDGLSVCIEMCIQALKMEVHDSEDCSITICKTISCLLPLDLEVKRACQLTEFLVKPSMESYYAVETVFNEPDQKLEEDPLILNSLRCDLLLALKTKWPFDPEFWDWKTLKRHCVALMSQEAASILSADKLPDIEDNETQGPDEIDFRHVHLTHSPTYELSKGETERKKKREMKKLRERGFVSARFRNWQAYMQYCVLCDKEFLGHRIVKHALKHVQDGIFRCPICAETFQTREILEPHVASHVKQSCKERLTSMNATKKCPSFHAKFRPGSSMLNKEKHYSKTATQVSQGTTICANLNASNCSPSTNGKGKTKPLSSRQSKPIRDVNNSKDCSCPVTSCQKVFKYFRNLVAHVKAHRDEQEAIHFLEIQSQKATCQYCHRQFVNLAHLNDHLQMHCGEKPYFCIQLGCNCSFSSHAELIVHRKVHAEFQAQCAYPNCERIFSETYLLYDHEAQHYMTFSCKRQNCGKVFYTLSELDLHQKEHAKQDHSIIDEEPHSQLELPAQSSLHLELPPSQVKEVSQEPSPVKIKCSVKSILNSSQGSTANSEHLVTCPALLVSKNVSQTSASRLYDSDTSFCLQSRPKSTEQLQRLESCYVKLEPIPIKHNDPIFLNALTNSDSVTQTLLKDKKLFCVPWSQVKHSTLKSSVTQAKREKRLLHVCPFETCTRKYSTSKSLSRHVKNVHSEAFEEWKLSKKYKRIAEIAARKSSSKHIIASSQIVKKWTCHSKQTYQHSEGTKQKKSLDSTIPSSSSVLSGYDSMQPVSAKLSSQLKGTQSNASPNQSGLMQLPLSQTWTTPTIDNMDSGFYVQNHYSPVTDNQHTNSLYHSDPILDDASSGGYDCITPFSINVHTPSSVMNEASKYVSSSLRVLHALNGDQNCDLSQDESASVDLRYSQTEDHHYKEISISTSLLHTESLSGQNISPCFSAFSSEASPISVQSLENLNKETSTDTLFSSDIKCISNFVTPNFKEQSEEFLVPVCSAVPQTNEKHPEDVCNYEMSQRKTEGLSSDEQIVSSSRNQVETKQTKKIKSSKRTKWPAIIQDGKVICCRCYREFSSTKSLGGHLSKRSQCKPVDEIDLTADLPVSFLDFLNDPDISTVQMPLPTSNVHDQNHETFIYPSSEPNVFTDNRPPSMHGKSCTIVHSQEHPEIIQRSTFCHPPIQETGIETKHESKFTPANTGEDGKIVEIERALQRLDLVDILNQETCAPESTDLHSLNTKTRNDHCHTNTDEVQNEQKLILKPFRCNEDCVYGAMTKEALFKHLCRVHDYSEDRINEMKKNPDKLAPYSCHLCSKTFTRTTGLKIHYKNVHHFSKEEMSRLKISFGFRKIRKFTVEFEDVHFSSITKQGVESEQNHYQVDPKLTMKNIDSNVKQTRAVSVATKKMKTLTQDSCAVISTKTKCDGVSQRNSANLQGLQAAYVKTLSSPAKEKHESVIIAAQKLSVESACPFGTINAPDQVTKDATTQLNSKIETNSDEAVTFQKTNNMPVNNMDSGDLSDKLSLYRPYRCVHEGCVAAFSIQQNLILHYRAMHQSESNEKTGGNTKEVDGSVRVQEYKCQVKQCSKVVSKFTSLLKHYLLLHKCTLEKASALLSGVEVGTFQCDQSKCSAHFTCHLKYIDHIKNDHKAIKVSAEGDFESVDLTFRCQFEGCDRVYTTKSNLLRHLMKKHHATFETMKEKHEQEKGNGDNVQAKQISSSTDLNNGKENIANHIKVKKNFKRKEDRTSPQAQNHWITFANPVPKSIDEASAMCSKELSLQYPCMIKSCDSVMNAEQNILKHYATHGLTERYVEDQRSHFIFCKKSKEIRSEKDCEIEAELLDKEQTGNSKVSCQNVGPEIQTATDVIVNESFTATSGIKRKRGRPRKSECRNKICLERKLSLRKGVKCMLEVSGSILNHQENHVRDEVALKVYRPSEFERSIFKFNEQSVIPVKRKTNLSHWTSKREQTLQPAIRERDEVQCIVNFRNPLKLKTVNNVKIVIYENISTSSDLLKQLQDMQPMVILKKWMHS